MKKFIFIVFCYFHLVLVNASNDFVNYDLEILKDLDIETSYIKDDKFKTFYESFSNKNEKHYENTLSRGQKYTSEISQILKKHNVPSVFLYMAMAESNFVLDAQSKKKALGLWQFMPETATQMGLKRDKYVDERLDFIKSTEAAAKYLNKLHGVFGSWYLAAISYNSGDGRLIEGLTRATIDLYCKQNDCSKNTKIQKYKKTLKDYEFGRVKFNEVNNIYQDVKTWGYKPRINDLLIDAQGSKKPYIPKESRNYIKKIISLAMMSNTESKNNTKQLISISDKTETNNMILKNLINVSNVRSNKLKELLDEPKVNKVVKIDNEENNKNKTVKEDIKSIQNSNSNFESDYMKIYIVQKGENLYRIAKDNNTNMEKIMKDNNLKTNKVKPGDKIVIKFK